jgi:hypothetical protein
MDRCAHLQLSERCDAAAAAPERAGGPVVRVDADPLAMLTRPAAVADALERLLRDVTAR